MNTVSYLVLGVMSGTSVDGVDFAYVKFTRGNSWNYEIIVAETRPYLGSWQSRLREAIKSNPPELTILDREYTAYLAEEIREFMEKHSLKNLDAICSHGHTVLHRPQEGITYQIGNRPELAMLTGKLVICDFRVQDVKLGGQGAPLVPVGDSLLFNDYDICLNLGGFANISFEENGKRLAYDICPVNIVLNRYAGILGMEYDDGGAIARENKVDENLLKKLNYLPFYRQEYPKSLGLEWVNQNIFPLLESSGLSPEQIIATFTEHVAVQIAAVLISLCKNINDPKILVTGGGAYNNHLISRIQEISSVLIVLPDKKLVEFKEALIFGFMGVLRLRNTVNVLRSVTGASNDHCSGLIFTPENNAKNKGKTT